MEVQVLHRAISEGDFRKQAVISVLFERKAGAENAFIESLNLLNLPNIYNTESWVETNLDLDTLFYPFADEFVESLAIPTPSSYYYYQGSLTTPPCDEEVTWFVLHPPQKVGLTSLELIKEVLQVPEMEIIGTKQRVVDLNRAYSGSPDGNNRVVYERGSRQVKFFDIEDSCEPSFKMPKKKQQEGHYERVPRKVNEYIYVRGEDPSGIPGALLVSEKEARGLSELEILA